MTRDLVDGGVFTQSEREPDLFAEERSMPKGREDAFDAARGLVGRTRICDGTGFRLVDHPPAWPEGESIAKREAKEAIEASVRRLTSLQDRLYAQDRWSVLLVFQAMDAAGKDGAIKHVMSGVNPQGCEVHPFKAPSEEERDHDWLWRCARVLPSRGKIGIFNRSYYEEVLVVRVREEILRGQKLPPSLVTERIWDERLADIRMWEEFLARNGTLILKFFLNVSRDEQRRRFLDRIEDPTKHWKFSASDVRERSRWNEYMHAYEEAIRGTAAPHAPWHVVPADDKWLCRSIVAASIIEALEGLDLRYPEVDKAKRAEIESGRDALRQEA